MGSYKEMTKETTIVRTEPEWNKLLKENKSGIITIERRKNKPTYAVLETDDKIYKMEMRPM
jgi:hypothetical protein